jgi:CelD/BcsL family acetyltransferase involved in cellulose biosynthesis
MRVRALSEAEFLGAGAWWDELLSRSAADSFFLRHAWLAAWWRHFGSGRMLRVIVAESDDGRIAGVAPWCHSTELDHRVLPVGEVSFLGRYGVTGDYLDVFAEKGRESEVLRACLAGILRDSRWDLLRVSDVLDGSPTLAQLLEEAPAHGLTAVPGTTKLCPYLPLPGTWDAFLASVSGNMRSNLRRREKKLAALGVRFEEARGAAIAPALDALFTLHGARWETKGLTGNFVDPRLRAFHHEIAPVFDREGAVGLWTAVLNGKPAAAIYGFRHRGRFLYYQAGFDPAFAEHGVGLALMGHAIKQSIAAGITEFDYLRGDEDYKKRWTDKARHTKTFVFARPNLRGFAWRTLSSGKETAKRFLRRAPAPASPSASPSASAAATAE